MLRWKKFFGHLAIILFFNLISLSFCAVAQSDSLILEGEQHWETYGVGGTCIPGQHNLFVADVDDDNTEEIVTGGYAYDVSSSVTSSSAQAPLNIWSWNGQNVTLEHSEKWGGNIGVVYVADVDGDGKTEIITSGGAHNGSKYVSTLRFWNWDDQTMILRGSYGGISVSSVCVADVDGDNKHEVITVGKPYNSYAQLSVWKWNGDTLSLRARVDCVDSKNGTSTSVFAFDLNNDGVSEIITAGYVNNLINSTGQLRVWLVNSDAISLESSIEWQTLDGYSLNSAGDIMGNTVVSNVKVSDIDNDDVPEIVTGGFTYNGVSVDAQLRIWNWSGEALNLEVSREWSGLDITELKTIAIDDVDGDGRSEVVASGGTVGYGSFAANSTEKETAQLRIWSWDGKTLTLERSQDWVIGEGVMAWNVATGDLDADGIVEIVTVGCMYVGTLCDPDMRIWSMQVASEASVSFSYLLAVIVGATVSAIVAFVALILYSKKRRSLQ